MDSLESPKSGRQLLTLVKTFLKQIARLNAPSKGRDPLEKDGLIKRLRSPIATQNYGEELLSKKHVLIKIVADLAHAQDLDRSERDVWLV